MWSQQTLPVSSGTLIFYGLSCVNTTDCWATAYDNIYNNINGSTSASYWLVAYTTDAGTKWQQTQVCSGGGCRLSGISCPSTSMCWIAGSYGQSNGSAQQAVFATTDGVSWSVQKTWAASQVQVDDFNAISCPTTTACTAGGGDYIVSTLDAGKTWTATADLLPVITAISCTSRGPCWALLNATIIYRPTSTSSWVTEYTASQYTYLFDVACSGAGNCIAVGEDSGPGLAIPAEIYARTPI